MKSRIIFMFLGAFVIAMLCLNCSQSPVNKPNNLLTQPATASLPTGLYYIIGKSSRCLDVNSRNNGGDEHDKPAFGRLQLWDCAGNLNQKFLLTPNGSNFEIGVNNTVRPADPDHHQCLDVEFSSHGNGAGVYEISCTGGANQHWNIQPRDGWFEIRPSHDLSKCLDVANQSTGNSSIVNQWECNNQDNQLWRFEPVS